MSNYDPNKGKGKILKRADPSTIQDKFLVGYQGWFTCGGDGEPVGPGHHGWVHWFDAPIPDGGHPNTDLWPDVSSYSPSELFPAPGLKNADGEQLFLFSSRHPKTVQRHFHWMAEHGVDGAFLQRFATQCDLEGGSEGIRRIRDEVGDLVRQAAEKEGRVFAIMYDVTAAAPDRIQQILEHDWLYLIREKGILDSPNYLREKGKPVVSLWGFGFDNAGHTPELVRALTNFIRNVTPGGAYIMAGTPAHWRTAESDADRNPEFLDVWLNEFDAISPWTIGRYGNEQEADHFAETKMKGDVELIRHRNEEGRWRKIDYIPVVLPGGSGYNMTSGEWSFNGIKRNGGRFLWKQIFNAKRLGVRIIYGAMWDEYDEGTAFLPVVEKKTHLPESDKHLFLALDEDGYDIPSDWYMRICGFAAEAVRGERMIHETFPSKELQDYWATRPRFEEVDHKSGNFVSGSSDQVQGGSGGSDGQTYQDWLATQKEDKEEPPPPPYTLEAEEESTEPQPAPTPHQVTPESTAAPEVLETRAASPPIASVSIPGPASTLHSPLAVPIRQETRPPPPVNSNSRPQQLDPPHIATTNPSLPPSPTPIINSYPSNIYTGVPSQLNAVEDPVVALTNDFDRHGLASPGRTTSSPPPLHPAHPAAVQGGRPSSSNSRPPYSPSYLPSNSPITGSYPSTQPQVPQSSGSWSQAQWPPPEWQVRPQHKPAPPQQPYPGSRPQQTTYDSSSSNYAMDAFAAPGASSYTPDGPPALDNPPFPGGSIYSPASPTSSYPSQSGPSSYGPSLYTPPSQGFPQPSPPHSPPFGGPSPYGGGSYYPTQQGSPHGFPAAQTSSYAPYGSNASYGGAPLNDGPPQGGGFHFPQAPSTTNNYGTLQAYSGYNPGYGAGTPYGSSTPPHASMPSPSSSGNWSSYPGTAAPSTAYPRESPQGHPPVAGPPTHSSYSSSPNSNPGPAFPSASSGILDTALNTVDKIAGKKARTQLESVAQCEFADAHLRRSVPDGMYSGLEVVQQIY
ncbi:hypothetical protein H0H81_009855 [Sphagnurus paluster]|uniref:Xylosidase/arabinosidase n=1 Tax=Sphagnurus paluster TaxID=117069 RepID=A0A9P7GI89_9AGAR|nr:hypothetical protein H0H81_009855 [Sphagnurus paluster]